MSGVEVMGAISAVITILESAVSIYDGAQKDLNLSDAFKTIRSRLPILLDTLSSCKSHLDPIRNSLTEDVCEALEDILARCDETSGKLRGIFEKVIPGEGDKAHQRYTKILKRLGKGSKVEELMLSITNDVQLVVNHHAVKSAGAEQVRALDEITQEMKALQSIPEGDTGKYIDSNVHTGSGHIYDNFGIQGKVNNASIGKIYEGDTVHKQRDDFSFRKPAGFCLGHAPCLEPNLFIGRTSELSQMSDLLRPGDLTFEQRRLVLGGKGGMGKTQLAIAFAMRHRQEYGSVFWLNATSEITLKESFQRMAETLFEVHEPGVLANEQSVTHTKRWLSDKQNAQWLLIFDNYDRPDQYRIEDYYPSVSQGAIIVTTRRPDLVAGRSIGLQPLLNAEESLEILKTRSERKNTNSDIHAQLLARRLGGLPLALASAGAYLHQTSLSFERYLEEYERRCELDQQQPYKVPEYKDRTLYVTWEMSYNLLKDKNPDVAKLLDLLAYFSNQRLQYRPFQAGVSSDSPEWLRNVTIDDVEFSNAVRSLAQYGFLEIDGLAASWTIHACVHDWTFAKLDQNPDVQKYWYALDCVCTLIEHTELFDLHNIEPADVTSHAFRPAYVGGHRSLSIRGLERKVALVANLLQQQDQLTQAEQMLLQALRGKEKALGAEHTLTLDTVNNLGNLYVIQGRIAEAEQIYLRVLRGNEILLGVEHITTLETVNNLGNLYAIQGKIAEAEQMYIRALRGKEKAWGAEHVTTLETINNLGNLYAIQGKIAEAEQIYLRALRGKEKALGAEHTSTLDIVNNLGNLYAIQDRIAKAEQIYLRALRGREKALGAEHTSTLETVDHLGNLYVIQGRIVEAEQMYIRALRGKEKAWGAEHVTTLETINNLGNLYAIQGRIVEAEQMYLRALRGKEKVWGAKHTLMLSTVINLANLYFKQGRLEDARMLYNRARSDYYGSNPTLKGAVENPQQAFPRITFPNSNSNDKYGAVLNKHLPITTEDKLHLLIDELEYRTRAGYTPLQASAHPAHSIDDSGYATNSYKGSMLYAESTSDIDSIVTDGTSYEISRNQRQQLISEFAVTLWTAAKLTCSPGPNLLNAREITQLLKAFTILLRATAKNGIQRHAVSFIRHRRDVIAAKIRERIDQERDQLSHVQRQPGIDHGIYHHSKDVHAWLSVMSDRAEAAAIEETSPDITNVCDQTSDTLSDSDSITDEHEAQSGLSFEPDVGGARTYIFSSRAFEWLATRLFRLSGSQGNNDSFLEAQLTLASMLDKQMSNINIDIRLAWNPSEYLSNQYFGQKAVTISESIVYCGTMQCPFATTAIRYARILWPTIVDNFFQCLQEACDSRSAHVEILDTQLDFILAPGVTHVRLYGTDPQTAMEIGELCIWLATACRASQDDTYPVYAAPEIHEVNGFTSTACLNIGTTYSPLAHEIGTSDSGCWLGMVRNPVICSGYPVPYRTSEEKGLQLSFSLMLALSQATWATIFDSHFLFKGMNTALVPVAVSDVENASSTSWHFLINQDKSRMTYVQASAASSCVLGEMDLANLEKQRHFVGMWLPEVQSQAGRDSKDLYPLERSSSQPMNQRRYQCQLSSLTLTAGKYVTLGATLQLGRKDVSVDLTSPSQLPFVLEMERAGGLNMILYGTKDQRGWLLDGASIVLHLAKAWMHHTSCRHIRPEAFQDFQMCDSTSGKSGRIAAVDTLYANASLDFGLSTEIKTNLETSITSESGLDSGYGSADFTSTQTTSNSTRLSSPSNASKQKLERNTTSSTWTFGHIALEIWQRLQIIHDALVKRDLDPPSFALDTDPKHLFIFGPTLLGWETFDLLSLNPYIAPRIVELSRNKHGRNWSRFARSSHYPILFARTFGDLLRPSQISNISNSRAASWCPKMFSMPPDHELLAVPLYVWADAKNWIEDHGSTQPGCIAVSDHGYWHSFDPSECRCLCIQNKGQITPELCCISGVGSRSQHDPGVIGNTEAATKVNVFEKFPRGAALIGCPPVNNGRSVRKGIAKRAQAMEGRFRFSHVEARAEKPSESVNNIAEASQKVEDATQTSTDATSDAQLDTRHSVALQKKGCQRSVARRVLTIGSAKRAYDQRARLKRWATALQFRHKKS